MVGIKKYNTDILTTLQSTYIMYPTLGEIIDLPVFCNQFFK